MATDSTKLPDDGGDARLATGSGSGLTMLGRYRVLRLLARGGMSLVYVGYDTKLGRQVALKVIADHLVNDRESRERFRREAELGSFIHHPHVVRTLSAQADRATGRHFLVLEFVDGPSAQFLLDQTGPLAVKDAVRLAIDCAIAMEHLHEHRIVHRDIKPANILINNSGIAKLADLGLAKNLDEPSELTSVEQGFGTSWYMPYEQVQNASFVDGRSDIFALGATLYHLVTGQVPFPGDQPAEVVARKRVGAFRKASEWNQSVPESLDRVLERMLAKNPGERYQSAGELLQALKELRLAEPIPSFINIDQALLDPAARARLVDDSQPTVPEFKAVNTPFRASSPIGIAEPAKVADRIKPAPRSLNDYWTMLLSAGVGVGLLAAASAAALCRYLATVL